MAKAIKAALVVTFIAIGGALLAPVFGGAALTTAALTSLAATTFATTLVAGVIGGMTSKGINATGANFGTKFATRASTNPRQLIYGKCRVGGTIVHMETTGTDNFLLHAVVVLSGHEIESLESVRLNDVDLTSSTSTISGSTVHTVTNSEFSNTENENKLDSNGRLIRFSFQDGSQTAANGYAVAQSSLVSTDKFLDCAYVYIQMVFDPEKFGGGMPNMSFVVKGKKVFDPRDSSTAWSDNPALCIRDYITDTTYGLKALSAEINDTTNAGGVAAAASACEVAVTLANGSSTEEKYTANGFTNFGASGNGVIEGLLSAMAGKMSYTNGQFNIFAGTTQTPSLTITDDNLLAPVNVSTNSGTGELYNTVKPIYVDSTNNFIAADAPVYQDSTFLTEDTPNGTTNDKPNYVKQMEKQLPFTVTHTMAQRIGRLALKNQRLSTSLSCLVDLSFMKLQPADWVYVTNERLGFSQKIFEVISVNMEVMQTDNVPTLGVRLALKETAASTFAFATSDYQANIAAGSNLASGGGGIAAPTNLSAATDTTTVDSLTTTSVTLSWTNAISPLVTGSDVQFKKNGAADSAYTSTIVGKTLTKQTILGLEIGVAYNFRVRHIGGTGIYSDYASANHTVVGTATAKADLTNSTVDYSSDGTGTMPANRGGTGITNFANSTHLNSNTTPANIGLSGGLVVPTVFRADNAPTALAAGDLWVDTNDGNKLYRSTGTGTGNWVEVSLTTSGIGLGNVQNKSSATILGETHTGNVTGTIGGVANSTITTGASRAASVIDSNNRFIGDLTGNVRSNGTTKSMTEIIDAHDRATAGLDSSGNVQRAVPQAQLTNVVTASVNQQAFIWTELSNAGYAPSATTFTFNVTWKDGNGTAVATSRWVATRDTTNDHIDNSGITNNLSGSGVSSSVVGGDSAFMAVTFTKGGTSITVSASLITFTGFTFKE